MAYISDRKISEDGVSYLFCESKVIEGVWKEAEEMLKEYPELVESYEKLNKPIKPFSVSTNSKIMPNTYQNLIENCLDEEHNNAALDLLDSFQNEQHYPPKFHIRQMMDIIVSPKDVASKSYKMMDIIVNQKDDKDIELASKSYKILQHVLYSTGSIAFENIWNFEKVHSEHEDVWPAGYDNFWMFIKDKFNSLTQDINDVQSTRILLLLEQIVSVFEIDMQIKQGKFLSSILLRLITRPRTNLRIVIDSLITSVFSKETSMEVIRLSQRLLDQIIILSYAGHICCDSLKNEIYLQINKLEPSRMILFLQTLLSNTFRYQLLDKALLDSDLSNIKQKQKQLINLPLSLAKIVKIFFCSTPYNKNLTEPIAIWRHIFFLSSILQSYLNAKTLRQGKVVIIGLYDDELSVVFNGLINKKQKELKKWLKQKDLEDFEDRTELLLEMMGADAKRINASA